VPHFSVNFISTTKLNKAKEAPMSINNTLLVKKQQSVLLDLKTNKGLPFHEVLSSDIISESIETLKYRRRIFTPDITLWALLFQVLDDDQSLQAAVTRVGIFLVNQGKKLPSLNTSAYSQARARLSESLLMNFVRKSGLQLEAVPNDWLWKNKNIKLIDGTIVSMPDTIENQKAFSQHFKQKEGFGFPLARILAIISYATGTVCDIAIGSYAGKGSGEHTLLRQIMNNFKPGDVVLGDAYYGTFFLLSTLIQSRIEAVFPIHGSRNRDFRRGKRLGKKDHIIEWKRPQQPPSMKQELYDTFSDKIRIRKVVVQVNKKGFCTKSGILVTTFLDPIFFSKQELSELYDRRWHIGLDLRSIKETMCMGILRSKTPDMVRKEIWAHLLADNLVRKLMAQSAIKYGKISRELSFKLALRIIAYFRQICIFSENYNVVYSEILKGITYKKAGNRPGRQEPRKVKRRPKGFQLLQTPRQFYKKAA
jgi:hypothetical protein